MAGESPELGVLARQLAVLDDDALAALANKGLVRRAHKDVQRSAPRHIGSEGDQLTFDVEGQVVRLGAVPTAARCDCGASAVCRHVLTVLLYLRDKLPPADVDSTTQTDVDPVGEIMAVTPEALEKWAGKALFRQAVGTPHGDAQCDVDATIIITLPFQNATVRWLAARGLDGMLCTCHASGPCKHKVTAVLAFWSRQGRPLPQSAKGALEASSGSPRTRDEVLTSVRQILSEMVMIGIERVSDATRDRLKTLAVSAHGVDLPRLERVLNVLATETGLLLTRDAHGDSARVLRAAGLAWALAVALVQPVPALVGVHRSKYEQAVGELELIGIGARRWRTQSGFEGLTVYFWEVGSQCWNTWTDTRPLGQPFDPRVRYTQEFPWSGVRDPREASRSRYRVAGVFRNPVGRLSGRQGPRAVRMGDTNLAHVPSVKSWRDLRSKVERAFGGGLTDQTENENLVFLAPANLGDATYDEVDQVLHRELIDTDGCVLPLRVVFDENMPRAVEHVESVRRLEAVFGQLRAGPDGVYLEPITLVAGGRLVHTTLDGDGLSATAPSQASSAAGEAIEVPSEHEFDSTDIPGSSVGMMLRTALDQLEDVAAAGLRVHRDLAPLHATGDAFDMLSLVTCRDAVRRTIEALEHLRRGSDRSDAPGCLLESSYVLRLALHKEVTAIWSQQYA